MWTKNSLNQQQRQDVLVMAESGGYTVPTSTSTYFNKSTRIIKVKMKGVITRKLILFKRGESHIRVHLFVKVIK
jgi:hypothetical protein